MQVADEEENREKQVENKIIGRKEVEVITISQILKKYGKTDLLSINVKERTLLFDVKNH